MGSAGVPLLLLVGALSRIPGSEGGREPPAHFLCQAKLDCHFLNGTQRVRYLKRFFYDRQEIDRFDSDLGEFVSITPLGQADYWNTRQDMLQVARAEVNRFCRYNYEAAKTGLVIGW
ncbi:HLA class II histocompatibility antigen, DRB1-15 beta chain-like, partial [Python bivittatus]|uniref:HLA class II histocompatibility antigen, DRB1-15 beta chain-like n=1 Tax=Python bivittatus TaxID=176946 RepID=A0A9F2R6V6_PYTBI